MWSHVRQVPDFQLKAQFIFDCFVKFNAIIFILLLLSKLFFPLSIKFIKFALQSFKFTLFCCFNQPNHLPCDHIINVALWRLLSCTLLEPFRQQFCLSIFNLLYSCFVKNGFASSRLIKIIWQVDFFDFHCPVHPTFICWHWLIIP